ncbi:tRNA (adenine(22)-N(1))-methyltransferase TrmK [Neobacillus sp. PS3-40]|uniref:tRNA (adenine(22)-N(1))-methyltransferase n=1 Tax=Neobacillus sp. PS3-40 TaxID=3070679 RepID=UPI0027E02108|nr:tRNA (adenine(22)-N(1))-methyltransferase TrmK [Neobacillus sp. PS3-40]WML46400.1 tRNA (adenine(22)-N(1))-methyltransferase TrmK [Neobacillus sp. PS3-40]
MNTEKLSNRLDTVAGFVTKGSKLADIGSDHAYLPCFLAKKGVISFAIAGEVVAGPFESARKQVLAEELSDAIDVRMGDGLDVLQPGEVDCITIAGMGGALITSILERGKEKLHSVKRLVLQPNISAISIRKWLLENSWELVGEEILEEDGKIYEILVAEKGEPERPYSTQKEAGLLLGPFLLQKREEPFKKKWSLEIANWQRIYEQLENASKTAETVQKKHELLLTIKLVEEVLAE